jgi:apolipoprotein N-acyltransferase
MAGNMNTVLAIISGILLMLGFPQFDLYPLAWVALVPLLIAAGRSSSRASFYLGLLTGMIYFTGTIYWVYHSMYYYGHLPFVLSILFLIILSLYLALYVAAFSLCYSVIRGKWDLPALVIAPVLWVTFEYLRTYALTGFPWSLLGYSQYKALPLIQIADITGVYGVSFLVAAANSAVCDVASLVRSSSAGKGNETRWPVILSTGIFTVFLASSLWYGAVLLKAEEGKDKVKVSVIQGNIPQDRKWDVRFQRDVIDTYETLSRGVLKDHPDLIVWPESALPFVFGYDEKLSEEILNFEKEIGTYLLMGSVVVKDMENGNARLSNSAVLLSPDGGVESVYDKIHLVPFGEYVPLKRLLPFVGKMVTAIGDFVPGTDTVVMDTPFARIGNLICYEIIFPGLVRKFVDRGADLLVTITNDAWFGRTAAPYQHFSMAVFRAIENRVPVVRAANTGISGFIDSRGRIVKKSGIFVESALTAEVERGDGKSFYTREGDIFSYLCIAGSAVMLIGAMVRRKKGG